MMSRPGVLLFFQVRELDKFAAGMAAKKKACLDQIEKDKKELAYVDAQIGNEAKK